MVNGCKDCKRRRINCHSSCEEYARFVEQREVIKRKEREYKVGLSGVYYTKPSYKKREL